MDIKKYDDEYLIALTNKGIVKRSYKDLEGVTIEIENHPNDITAIFDNVIVTLKENLTDSICTCPSRGICKHIITVLLFLNKSNKKTDEDPTPICVNKEELLLVDDTMLSKVVGDANYQKLINSVKQQRFPLIEEHSFVMVELFDGHKIRLFTPIGDSVCSCKSREMCKHKATAILYYKAFKGRLDLSIAESRREKSINCEEVFLFSSRIEEEITHILSVGLSRISHSEIEHFEKLSLQSHNVGLARHENLFRELSAMLQDYFQREVHFSESVFLKKLSDCFFLARKMREDKENLSHYMGVFRDEYAETNPLSFIPIGDRYIETKSGYAGSVFYFLEEESGEIYSYSDIRPTFYDNSKTAHNSNNLLWSINCPISKIMSCKFSLKNPRISKDRRISSSNQTKGTLGESLNGNVPICKGRITYDFRTLITMSEQCENDKVAFVMASEFADFGIDKLNNLYIMTILDENNYPIFIELKNNTANEKVIRILSALASNPTNNTLFIGVVYPENGRLKMTPIEYYSDFTPIDTSESEGTK